MPIKKISRPTTPDHQLRRASRVQGTPLSVAKCTCGWISPNSYMTHSLWSADNIAGERARQAAWAAHADNL